MFVSGTFNAALGRPTQQSSTLQPHTSDRAVDGKDGNGILDLGSCSLTTATPLTWWWVDLGRVYTVLGVRLTPSEISTIPRQGKITRIHKSREGIFPFFHFNFYLRYHGYFVIT